MNDLDDRDRDVLNVLVDGRANPKLIRDETGLDKGDVNTVLVRLGRGGLVRQITRGLYEITEEGRNEIGLEDTHPEIDIAEIRHTVTDLEAAFEHGDGSAIREAIGRLRDAIDA